MNNFTIRFAPATLLLFIVFGFVTDVRAQVFDPNDPVVVYNPANPPVQPPNGQVGKWVKTNRVSWNTSDFKSYIYKGVAFRLKYPKSYVPGNGVKYPMFVFFHGVGEKGPIYDNEYQLYHGAQLHRNAVNNGTFDGFLLYPQSTDAAGIFTPSHRAILRELIENFLIPQAQVDPFRISFNGLSGGGSFVWSFMINYPQLTAAALPMSGVVGASGNVILTHRFLPIWLFQGALDLSPTPALGRNIANVSRTNGTNFIYTEYPDRGHDTWNSAWREPNFYTYMLNAHKANPWVLFGRTSFCASEAIDVTMGVSVGFEEYEWRKDGVSIAGSDSNALHVTEPGLYACRVKRKGEWSPWSPNPVEIIRKDANEAPDITMKSFGSRVMPSPDGKTAVELVMPQGQFGYSWVDASNNQVATTYNYNAQPGTYKARIKESALCETNLSNPFTVIDANGPNKPDSVSNLIVNKVSKSSLRLDWLSNPNALYPATAYEIYMATKAGGPYQFAGITDQLTYLKEALTPGSTYYFVVRAVNNTAGAPLSREVSATTDTDTNPPTSPQNLKVTGTTQASISLSWSAATDDVGLLGYDIYINGVKTHFTEHTDFTVYNLAPQQHYTITVKARDISGNASPFSNQVSAQTISNGLIYKYYTGTWSNLPDFSALSPVAVGVVPNVSLAERTQETNYAFTWEGEITIPVSGNYTFRTNSDDGSRLYLGPYSYSATPLVDNDGTHAAQNADGTIYLTAGVYPIVITYFQAGGGQTMSVSWSTPQTGGSFVTIPNSAFVGASVPPGGAVPSKPTSLTVVAPTLFNKVNLSWSDNSNNEASFEVFRSENGIDFSTIAVLPSNSTSYQDTTVLGSTKYYYKVRAINQYGESAYDRTGRGVDYAYYETGALSQLPDFNTLIPVKTGRVTDFSLGMQERADNFAVRFTGLITLPVSGTYTFYLTSDDGSKLYIGGESEGNVVVNHDGLHGATEVSASKHFDAGTYPIIVKYFEAGGSEVLVVNYKGPDGSGIDKQIIPYSILGEEPVSVTTPVSPAPPAAPADLEVITQSASTIKLGWIGNGADVLKYQLYRSYQNNTDYFLYRELPGTASSFTDVDLFANTTFYYKVRAVGAGGESAFSNEVNATTLGLPAVIDLIENQFMRYGTQLQIPVKAANGTSETMTVLVENLPSFGSFVAAGDGTGVITFNNPTQAQQGVYNNITVKAVNPQSDTTVAAFVLTVNDNYAPVIGNFPDVVMNEKDTLIVTINATDQDPGEVLSWSLSSQPGFVLSEPNGGSLKLTLTPKYTQGGVYNTLITVKDSKQGKDTATLRITVNAIAVPGKSIYVNFSSGAIAGPASKWNNTNTASLPVNTTFASLQDESGATSSVGLKLLSSGMGVGNDGVNTGNNSGIYPDNVLQSHYWVDGSKNIEISGLTAGKRYNFIFMSSYNNDDKVYSAKYTIGDKSVSLNAAKNSQNTASIMNIIAPQNGILNLNVNRGDDNNATRAYLTAMVIHEMVDDATAPAKPKDLAVKLENDTVKLTWTNLAYNAEQYEVYRATKLAGPFTLLNPGVVDNNLQHFNDVTAAANKTYYYIIRVRNSYGVTNSQIVWLTVPNKAPRIENIPDVYVKLGETKTVNVKAVDDPTEIVTLTASGLPAFVTFTDNGGGNGVLSITASDVTGTYPGITITATDDLGASSSKTITINVIDMLVTSTYVNFNPATHSSNGLPWNDFNAGATVAAGTTVSNLRDQQGIVTPYTVRINEAMTSHTEGFITGNNGGVYDDAVISTGFKNTAATRSLTISGLPAGKYNLVFYANGPSFTAPRQIFTSGAVSDTLDVATNYMKTARLSGLSPVGGQITVIISKLPSNSANIYLGALVIEAHNSASLLPPSNLRVKKNKKTSIELAWDNNESSGAGIEVWRSGSPSAGYTKVADLPGSSKSYTDNGLTPGSVYYYKLRTASGGNFSEYSAYISAATILYSIDLNLNDGSAGSIVPAPWNNSNQLLTEGLVLSNLINSEFQATGVNVQFVQNFNGYDDFNGLTTGNNSGVVPDNAMKSFYYIQYGEVVRLEVTGLNQALSYNFVFFSSSKDAQGIYTNYIIGDKTVFLDWRNNLHNTAQINAKPDATGSVEILIITSTPGSKGYLNSLSIQALPDAPGGPGGTSSGRGGVEDQVSLNVTGNGNDTNTASGIQVGAYPVPFVDDITVDLELNTAKPKLAVMMRDASGKLVYLKSLENVPAGRSQHTLNVNGRAMNPGVYYLQVLSTADGKSSVIKVMK
ncbi:MAG: fibronectin type III domain-containing protein [Chitinophagaceae bacterium]|nr:fibronectin type III domain-containing protein [Chitinophagaceae bacterium]MCW5926355.1 fibronectin type III domain-containing protein [Chitinophagaceae bacterium]